MNKKPRSFHGSVDRRDVLKASAAATGLGSMVNVVKGRPGTDFGTTQFVETVIEHVVPEEDALAGSLPIFHWDYPLPHAVNDEKLYLRKTISEKAIDAVRNNPAVVKSETFHPLPSSVFGKQSTDIAYELGPHYRRNYLLELEDEFNQPTLTFQLREDDKVDVSTPSFEDVVPAGTERKYSLEPRDVTVELSKVTDERRENPNVPEHLRSLKVDRWTETIMVSPILRIKNFGMLQVIDAREELEVHK